MPAVTIDDSSKLPKIPTLDRDRAAQRPDRSVTTAPSRVRRRRKLPDCRRAFAGLSLSEPPIARAHGPDRVRVELRAWRAQGDTLAPVRSFETVTYMIEGTYAIKIHKAGKPDHRTAPRGG